MTIREVHYFTCDSYGCLHRRHGTRKGAEDCEKNQSNKKRIIRKILLTKIEEEYETIKFTLTTENQFNIMSEYIDKGRSDLGNYDGLDEDNKWCGEGIYEITYRTREYTGCTNYNFILKKVEGIKC